jgi:rare lipoprotein A
MGTWLNVFYPAKGTFVTVKVTDRGPWIRGRILDLSEQAAQSLGLKASGLGYVKIEPVNIIRRLQWTPSNTVTKPKP